MSALSDLRPKLKQDSVFLQTEEGVFLKNGEVVFSIKGKHIYRLMSRLAPYMTGEHTLATICKGLEAGQRVSIEKLVTTLLQRGIVKNHIPEAIEMLPQAVCDAFKMQIEFVDHYVEEPLRHFKMFCGSRLLLRGAGRSLSFLAVSLLRNGLRRLVLAPLDNWQMHQGVLQEEQAALLERGVESEVRFVDLQTGETKQW